MGSLAANDLAPVVDIEIFKGKLRQQQRRREFANLVGYRGKSTGAHTHDLHRPFILKSNC